MTTPLGTVIKQAREARGFTQGKIAAEFGITRNAVTAWEKGGGPQRDRMPRLAEMLGIDLEAALKGDLVLLDRPQHESAPQVVEAAAAQPQPNVIVPPEPETIDTNVFKGPRNVPVYGTGSGGDGKGDFTLNGQIIDHAPRPPGIANRKDVYVVYLVGDSVSPAYEEGSPIYVDPHRRPAPRDYVFVELRGEIEGEAGQALVKRFVRRGGGKLYLEQHNPPGPVDPINEADVVRVHRVIPWTELLGL